MFLKVVKKYFHSDVQVGHISQYCENIVRSGLIEFYQTWYVAFLHQFSQVL